MGLLAWTRDVDGGLGSNAPDAALNGFAPGRRIGETRNSGLIAYRRSMGSLAPSKRLDTDVDQREGEARSREGGASDPKGRVHRRLHRDRL